MTAHAMQRDRERCLAAGMDGYLCKPIDRQELIEMVERMADEGLRLRDKGMELRDFEVQIAHCNSQLSNLKLHENPNAPSQPHIPHPTSHIPRPLSLNPAPPFNLDQALERLGGKFALFKEMARYFFSGAAELLPEIQIAAAAGDAATMEKNSHMLKGTVLYLGAEAAVEAISRVETIGCSGNLADAAAAIRSLEEEVTRLAAALRPFCADDQGNEAAGQGGTRHSCSVELPAMISLPGSALKTNRVPIGSFFNLMEAGGRDPWCFARQPGSPNARSLRMGSSPSVIRAVSPIENRLARNSQ